MDARRLAAVGALAPTLALGMMIRPAAADIAPGPLARAEVSAALAAAGPVEPPPEVPEDNTIDLAGRQMMFLIGGLTAGVLTGKALFRR